MVTRPEPGASETAARLDALGFQPVLAPAIRIRLMPPSLPDPGRVAVVLVTSGQAVPALPERFRHARLFVVGDATAARARKAGFTDVTSASGDATDLVALVRTAVAPGAALLLATGRGLGHAVADALRAAGFAVLRRSVYAADPMRRLPPAAVRTLRSGGLRAALFFSADTATSFAAMVRRSSLCDALGKTDAVAISQPAAVALDGLAWRRIMVAARPNQEAMLALLQ
jgi:uroporphyrinogen-III synthase